MEKAIIAAFLFSMIFANLGVCAEVRSALVIGNSEYQQVPVLPNPQRDAASIASALKAEGFSVVLVQNANRAEMLNALNNFNDRASQSDWALVYYAGHGIEFGGNNYLLPVDVRLKIDRDAQDEAISLNRVLDTVASAKKLRIVLLDACRNNPFALTMTRSIRNRAVTRGLSQPEPQAGVVVVYAAAAGETAEDGEGLHSPFTTALLSRITEPGLEVSRLFNVVTADVLQSTNQRQRPYSYGSNPSIEEFYFRPRVAAPFEASSLLSPNAPSVSQKMWSILHESRDQRVLKTFRDSLPGDSDLRRDVEQRLVKLENELAAPHEIVSQPSPQETTKATGASRPASAVSRHVLSSHRSERVVSAPDKTLLRRVRPAAPARPVTAARNCFHFNGKLECE